MAIKNVPYADCDNCPLQKAPIAPSKGRLDAPIALVSRSPGKWDTSSGAPFSGPTGKLLDHLLQKYGKTRNDLFLTNVVLCYTNDPPAKAIECCRPRLDHEIDTLMENGLETIIAGGTEATEWMIGDKAVKKYRGRRIPLGEGLPDLVVTFNPGAALRVPAQFPDLEADIRRALVPPPRYIKPTIHVANDKETARGFINALNGYELLAADIEATNLSQFASLVSIAFAGNSGEGFVFGQNLVSDNEWLHNLKPLLEHRNLSWHNGDYDTKVLKRYGFDTSVHDDTLLLSYLLDERPGVHSLDYCLQNHLGWPYYTPPDVQWGKENEFAYPADVYDRCMAEVYEYNGMDAVGGYCLQEYLKQELRKESNAFS